MQMKYCLLVFSLLIITVAARGDPPNDVFGDPASPPGEELEKSIEQQDDEITLDDVVPQPKPVKVKKAAKNKKLPFCKRKQDLCVAVKGSACFCK